MLRCANLSFSARMLVSYMRALSLDYQGSAWTTDMEFDLWPIVISGRPTKTWPLRRQEIIDLTTLHQLCGGWVRYRRLDELLVDFGFERWEQLADGNVDIPEHQWYRVYTLAEWEAALMERSL